LYSTDRPTVHVDVVDFVNDNDNEVYFTLATSNSHKDKYKTKLKCNTKKMTV